MPPLFGRVIRYVEDLDGLTTNHLRDWPKSEMAACLFGGNEPPGRLITDSHEFVIIDSELTFASRPSGFDSTTWWGGERNPRRRGIDVATEVCHDFIALKESAIEDALAVPAGVRIDECWPISVILRESRLWAREFCERENEQRR